MQRINIGNAPLCCYGPVQSTDSRIDMLAGILGRLRQKKYEIHRPIIDRVTLLHLQQRPSALEAVTTTISWRAAAGSWSFPMLQKFYRQLLYRRDRERSPTMHTTDRSLIYSDLLLEGYSSASKQRRNTKLGTQSVKGL